MLMLLPPSNYDSCCSGRTKLQGEVPIPKEKAAIQLAWDRFRKCFGGQCKSLRFRSVFSRSVPTGLYIIAL